MTTRSITRSISGLAAVLTTGLVMISAGCGTVPPQPGPTAPAPPPTVQTPTPTPTPTPAACPSGSYRIAALKGLGSAAELGSGTGGDVTMAFTDGAFTLRSDGQEPVKLRIGPTRADLRLTGDVTGSYSGDASALELQVGEATGSVSVKGPFIDEQLTMRQLADQLVPVGTVATVTCTEDQATLTLPNLALSLTRG